MDKYNKNTQINIITKNRHTSGNGRTVFLGMKNTLHI